MVKSGKEIINQTVVSNGTYSSTITEYDDSTINARITGPSDETVVKLTTGTISTNTLNAINTKNAN